MTNGWVTRAALSIAFAGLAAGCAGDRSSQEPQSAAPAPAALVALTGCLEAAPGTNQYVLRSVRFEPRAGGDPHRTTTTPGAHGITEGAWVRVDGGNQDLKGHLGQRVLLKGTIADDGRNTIGTAGTAGVPQPSGDASAAANREHYARKQKKEMGRIARESMADGTAAEVRVHEISVAGDRCGD